MKIPKWTALLLLQTVCLSIGTNAHALNPIHESEFQTAVSNLFAHVNRLETHFSQAFRPDASKEAGGAEEIAWRMRDLQEKTQKLALLSKDYWKNETGILGILDRWQEDAKLIDEVMLYSPVSQEISDLWRSTKELGVQVRDIAEEIPSGEEWTKVAEDFGFEILKVGRYEKKQVLREKMKEFVGGSELDDWPFVDERQDLHPSEVGEHYVVRFKLHPKTGGALTLPLKLRFEYKFAVHHHDGFESATYTGLKGGRHDFVFKNMGKDYTGRGKVIHWRASIMLNDKIVAQKKSPMWTVVSEWAQK